MGQTFGRLTVIKETSIRKHRHIHWHCRCSCGKETIVNAPNLRSGRQQSCGCLKKECSTKHGYAKRNNKPIPEYRIWISMKNRCTNKNNQAYKYYGGRGIKVCERYKSFINFLSNLNRRPTIKHTIDRIDNNGHYSCGKCKECLENNWPMNIRWATRIQQANNTRSNHLLTYNNKTMNRKQWATEYGINYGTFRRRLDKLKWSTHDALTTPVEKKFVNSLCKQNNY